MCVSINDVTFEQEVGGTILKILKEIVSETHRKNVGCIADLFTFCVPCSDIQMCLEIQNTKFAKVKR